MWRAQTSRKGWHILNAFRRLATDPAPLQMPKPPPKSNIFRLLKILGLSVPLAATGLLSYAWLDQDFRLQLLDSIPYAKDLLGNTLPESDEIPPATSIQKPEVFTAGERASIINVQDVAKDAHLQKVSSEIDDHTSVQRDKSEAAASQKKNEKIDISVAETQLQRKVEDEKADNAALEAVVHKLLANAPSLVAEAVKAQAEAASSIRNHAKLLKQALDETIDNLQKDAQWEAVTIAHREREQALLGASERVSEAKKCVEKLQDVIQEGKTNRVTQSNPAILEASKQLNEFLKDLGSVNLQVRQAETEASVIQKYRELVDKGRKLFQKELESLVPATKHGSGIKLSEDELNTLIAHACRRIEQLQGQIAELQVLEKQKLTSSLEMQKNEDIRITDSSIAEERQRIHKEFQAEKFKVEQEYLTKLETEVRKQLARQAAAHNDHLKDALAVQLNDLNADFNQALQFKVLEERGKFQMEVAGWISRLKGIEAAIDSRAASEKLTQSAQNLWLACVALNSVITYGGDSDNQMQLAPLRSSVEAVLKAGIQNPFVELMANSFPNTALDRGVNTEEQLKHRFYRVSNICRRLGLVDTVDSSLFKYLISYLHSLVLFDNVVATSETDEVDLNTLDSFALLAHAKYWMDKGNLELAVRFMNQLNGEPGRAASDWVNEARLFLETKQISRTLMAYASATGLAKTF